MSWLHRVRKSIALITKRETPDNLWHKCPKCAQMIFTREFEENGSVCPKCDHHGRIGPKTRFDALFDEGSWTQLAQPGVKEDPLKFRDQKRYADRIKAARHATGEQDALLNAKGKIEGQKAVIGARQAIADKCPYIIFTAAGGARMQEGILSLMQMPKTTVAIAELHDAGLPYIVVLTDPTTGGVTASYAMLGDVQIAEPNALICFAGPRVIEQTIREKLPEGFQRAEYLLDHGMLDRVTHRKALREELVTILRMLMNQSPAIKGDLPPPGPVAEAIA